MNELIARGVAVIPLSYKEQEFKVSNQSTLFVLGANASSQHHPEIRKLRTAVYSHICPLFASVYAGKYVELIPDRLSIRNQAQPITAKSCSAEIGPNDVIYGGYLNLDERQTQYFYCSHVEKREVIAVPPRCIILFNEKMVHEITKRKIKEAKSYRQYFKWRISEEPVSTIGEEKLMNAILNQSPFTMQNPPMYESQCELFPEYTQDEIGMLFPRLLVKMGRL